MLTFVLLNACKSAEAPKPPAKLAFISQPTTATAGAALAPQVAIQDESGGTVTSATSSVTLAIGTNPANGVLSGTLTVAAVNGVATFSNASITKAGAGYTLTASLSGLTGATSAAFTVNPGPAAKLAFTTQPASTTAGATLPPVQVTIFDAFANVVTSGSQTVIAAIGSNPGSATLTGTTSVSAVNGIATFSNLSLNKAGTGYTLSVTASGLTAATSGAFNIQAGTVAKVRFTTQPTDAVAGQAISPSIAVTLYDAYDNVSPSGTVTLGIATNPGAASLSGNVTVAAQNGVATFSNISIRTAASGYALSASASPSVSATSNTFNIQPGPVATLRFTAQPSNAVAGAIISPAIAVTLYDAYDNVTPQGSITLSIANNPRCPDCASLFGTLTVAAQSGVSTFSDISIQKAANGYTLTASVSPSLSAGQSNPFNVSPAPATKLAFTQQPGLLMTARQVFSVNVAVQDNYGNVVTSATNSISVAMSANSQGASLTGGTINTTTNGVAWFNVAVNKPGTGYAMSATATGLTSATSSTFDVAIAFRILTAGGMNQSSHTCGVTVDSAAYCWGSNQYGQLGDGTTMPRTKPVQVQGGIKWAALSAGTYHTCGISYSGSAYCWGGNFFGQLGIGTTTPPGGPVQQTTPAAVSGGLTLGWISAGDEHTCATAGTPGFPYTPNSTGYCWGFNSIGQLGDGTTNNRTTPGVVSGGLGWSVIRADSAHTCGVAGDGTPYCWGYNGLGELGDGTTISRLTPTAVSTTLKFFEIRVGAFHTCGLLQNSASTQSSGTVGKAYCWGANTYGQLGDGTTTNRTTAVAVLASNFGTASSDFFAVGWYHTCAPNPAGGLLCWGLNADNQLGDGTTANHATPVSVVFPSPFNNYGISSVAAAQHHTCLVSNSAAWCWGANQYGELGDGTTTSRSTAVRVSPP